MNRLTRRYGNGIIPHKFGIACSTYCDGCSVGSGNCEDAKAYVQRLAQIEDILGDDYDLARLREIVDADRDGRCFTSDVKLGGEVFYIPKFNGKPYCGIKSGHVQAVSFTKAGKRVKIREHHAHNQDFMIGKTVFLSREEAEAALEKLEE